MKKLLKKKCKICKKTKLRKSFRVIYRKSGENIRPQCKKCEATIFQSSTPRLFISSILNGIKQRAKTKLTLDQLYDLYLKQNKMCALSGIKLTHKRGIGIVYTNISVDRIDPKKGYTISNIQLVCRVVNLMKSDIKQQQFINLCNKVMNYNKEKQ